MKTLLKNGQVINVFTDEIERVNVLIEDDKIIGVGAYSDADADVVEDVSDKYICPGFIDGHIHIESTMLTPTELAKLCLLCGTTSIVADPHEIANVCGVDGIEYILQASENLPFHVYVNLPSCVPATPFDEAGAVLTAEKLLPLYNHPRVIGLAEMMNYPGVLFGDSDVLQKLANAKKQGKIIDGHAPFLTGKDLDKYLSAGIQSDHECSDITEAKEKLKKGQWIMIRQGTAARNLQALLPLFDEPYSRRCVLVTDDRHPADLRKEGHIDNCIRLAVQAGKSPLTAIRMASLQTAQCFRIPYVGAVAPGYRADVLVLNNLERVEVESVYISGKKVVDGKRLGEISTPKISPEIQEKVERSFHTQPLTVEDFTLLPKTKKCRIIEAVAGQLLTNERIEEICWDKANGVDVDRDILKLAVIERHKNTGHIGLGFIQGIGLKKGAIASSVSHDSHNVIVIGTNAEDMAIASNRVCEVGGNVVVCEGKILAEMPLPIAGLMTEQSGEEISKLNELVRKTAHTLGVPKEIEPFMNMAFVSLPVIPHLKMSTQGLVDVDAFTRVSLYVED